MHGEAAGGSIDSFFPALFAKLCQGKDLDTWLQSSPGCLQLKRFPKHKFRPQGRPVRPTDFNLTPCKGKSQVCCAPRAQDSMLKFGGGGGGGVAVAGGGAADAGAGLVVGEASDCAVEARCRWWRGQEGGEEGKAEASKI